MSTIDFFASFLPFSSGVSVLIYLVQSSLRTGPWNFL
uniref:Uncharacterized protein n=1 Tax=Lepeophtheirus salmonis TaxID=72036 RepID=A0A0K2TJ41_LEPSM